MALYPIRLAGCCTGWRNHPGAIHLYIHLTEASSTPERAEPYADRLAKLMPGSGHLCSGQTTYVKLRYDEGSPRRVEDLFIRDRDGNPLGGLKMANGTNSMN